MKKAACVCALLALLSPALSYADTTQNIFKLVAQISSARKIATPPVAATPVANSYTPAAQSPALIVGPIAGLAPLSVHFQIVNWTQTEAIIFGDGHYTGQTCTYLQNGWCDLSKGFDHTYDLPGDYTVLLYTHPLGHNIDGTLVYTVRVQAQ